MYCSTSGDVLPFWQNLVSDASRINIPVDARRDGHLGPRPSAGLKRTHKRHGRQTGSAHPDGCGGGQCQDLGRCQDPHVQAEKGQGASCSSSCSRSLEYYLGCSQLACSLASTHGCCHLLLLQICSLLLGRGRFKLPVRDVIAISGAEASGNLTLVRSICGKMIDRASLILTSGGLRVVAEQ